MFSEQYIISYNTVLYIYFVCKNVITPSMYFVCHCYLISYPGTWKGSIEKIKDQSVCASDVDELMN